ncbi:putative ribonuclease H-like domain-containing protein [Tanacetum coccineum]
MNQFCQMKGIKREFSVARTPQQNGVAKRKNRTLIEAARTMLADSVLHTTFWAEVINTACYVQNRVLITKPHNKTPYELLIGRPPNLDFMRPFRCPVTILNILDHLGKFEGKANVGFLVGYYVNCKEFRVFNTRHGKVEENLHIKILENKSNVAASGPEWLFDIDSLTKSINYEPITVGNQTNGDAGMETNVNTGQATQEKTSNHEYILLPLMPSNSPLSSSTQSSDDKDNDEVPGKGDDDVNKVSGINDQERPDSETRIFDGTYDDEDVGTEVDLNNLETTMNVSHIPTTRIHKDHPKDQIIVEKALYGLHQALRAWYQTLSTYLLENRFRRGTIDKTLFIKKDKGDILLVQVYVDDIIFGSTRKSLCIEFEQIMHNRFHMSLIGELTFFIWLHVMQRDDGIFISQDKYVADILKKFDFSLVKTTSTLMEPNKALIKDAEAEDVDVHLYRSMIGSLMYLTASRPDIMFAVCACARFQVTPKVSHLHAVKRIFRYLKGHPKLGLWYPRDSPFNLEAFSDSDYARASLDKKSTTGGCQFLGKKVLWIQNQMLDHGFNFINTKIYIDNESTICIVKNLVYHSKTKHIEIKHHFIRDSHGKKLIQVIKIHTDQNIVDLLTKAFDVGRFQYLTASIGMLNL